MKTKIKIPRTLVTYFDSENNTVATADLLGRVSVPDCRSYVVDLGENFIFVKKENTHVEILALLSDVENLTDYSEV